ncbi:MAG: CHAT domain-containing protein [Gammaproteobacteria bacterium]|nr:CHAT domain-containing protein [Gammaproteobacteria bacterium]
MPSILRFTQHPLNTKRHRVELVLEDNGLRETAAAEFEFLLSNQDREDIRWYLEDFLEYPQDPAPKIAKRVEERIQTLGTELFRVLFGSDDARDLWAAVRPRLNKLRVEISTGIREANSLPWELLRDPKTDIVLALHATAFVRVYSNPAQRFHLPEKAGENTAIRILLAICRPKGDEDVPFRSVAGRLVKGLEQSRRVELTVLRPPLFSQLGAVLRDAARAGKPFHVLHFDGHGTYDEAENVAPHNFSQHQYGTSGKHGYLFFENSRLSGNLEAVGGTQLGQLLRETGVAVLVLNACRSAHAEAPEQPLQGADSPHDQTRAFGSLAQEIADAGVAGVVAMRYNVYVKTAAQFVVDLYAALIKGQSLGEAVSFGRKQLHADPLREIAYTPTPLQDWQVPLVYEACPLHLFPFSPQSSQDDLHFALKSGADDNVLLPATPDIGFIGRDETLLALDRAFDKHAVVLLHAYAGSGKTAATAEFARWYRHTGGVPADVPVLFTKFTMHKTLKDVLLEFGRVFADMLEQRGTNWPALSETAQRRDIALQVLAQRPLLWIWDNVEPVAGFPAGADSQWSSEEQTELVDFLRAAKDSKAKFLLTSRRDEKTWLRNLPARFLMPPMPMRERTEFARALFDLQAERHGQRLLLTDWRPLLRFTQGNPLTLTVVIGQALHENLNGSKAIRDFITRLQSGETELEDNDSEARDTSLAVSLSYGFVHAFDEAERRILALLVFFQGFVDVNTLRQMGYLKRIDGTTDNSLPVLQGLSRDTGMALLDRAADIGLLTKLGGGFYRIHPALPWYFQRMFCAAYGEDARPAHTFVVAMGEMGHYYFGQYHERGNREAITNLQAEEANLLVARKQALQQGWHEAAIKTMQGLRTLYDYQGWRVEWADLVTEILPHFINPVDDGPLPECEEHWGLVNDYRVHLAQENRDYPAAERLQKRRVDWNRQLAATFLPDPPTDGPGRYAVRTLAVSLHELGQIQRNLADPDNVETYHKASTLPERMIQEQMTQHVDAATSCLLAYREALALSEQIKDQELAALCAFNLGHVYKNLSLLRDLDQAQDWYQRSLDLRGENDLEGQGSSLNQLGFVAYKRFEQAYDAGQGEAALEQINTALKYYQQALQRLPATAVHDLAVTHNQLGMIYDTAGELEASLSHYRESIRYKEATSNFYGMAHSQRNIALVLLNAGRHDDAREYAIAALENYQRYGTGAAQAVKATQQLLAKIKQVCS